MRVSVSPLPSTGRVSLAPVLEARVASSRYEDVFYTVIRHADGTWSCTCPAVSYGSRMDRQCKHIDQAAADLASPLALMLASP